MKKTHHVLVDDPTYEALRKCQGEFIRQHRKHISILEIIRKKFEEDLDHL